MSVPAFSSLYQHHRLTSSQVAMVPMPQCTSDYPSTLEVKALLHTGTLALPHYPIPPVA